MKRAGAVAMVILAMFGCRGSLAGIPDQLGNRGGGREMAIFGSTETPAVAKQGGDTTADAFVIPALPFLDTGTTAGYSDNYTYTCPYPASGGRDVVYSFTPQSSMTLSVDLCGSEYDTRVYVLDSGLGYVACNDDFYPPGDPCGAWVSWIGAAELIGGENYFIFVDGCTGGDFGEYRILVEEVFTCPIDCPPGGMAEGEPTLYDFYHDSYNSGCYGNGTPFQELPFGSEGNLVFCGKSGWYTGDNGWPHRDTDWLIATIGSNGFLEVEVESEQNFRFQERGPQDCSIVGIVQEVHGSACQSRTMTVVGEPGSPAWLWFAPMTFEPPNGFVGHEFDYQLNISGGLVATEVRSWGNLKRMYGGGR